MGYNTSGGIRGELAHHWDDELPDVLNCCYEVCAPSERSSLYAGHAAEVSASNDTSWSVNPDIWLSQPLLPWGSTNRVDPRLADLSDETHDDGVEETIVGTCAVVGQVHTMQDLGELVSLTTISIANLVAPTAAAHLHRPGRQH